MISRRTRTTGSCGAAASVSLGFALFLATSLALGRPARADIQLAQAPGWPPPPLSPPMAPAVTGPRVTLHTDNPNARLQAHTPLRWVDVCVDPCGVIVDPSTLLRVGGGTSIASQPFQLPRPSGDVLVEAQVGSKVKHWTGLGLMIGGGVAALYGLLYWQFSRAFRDIDTMNGTSNNNFSDSIRNIGLTVIGVGVALEITGIVLFSSRTSVEVH